MALMPSRVKFRKAHRGRVKGFATRGNRVSFGDFGLQSLGWAWVSGRQIEAGRVAAQRSVPEAKIWIRVFPHKPITAKPAEVRMGTGKGEPEYYAAEVKPGTMLYELGGVPEEMARVAMKRIAHKLPVKVKMVLRKHA